MSHVPVLLGPQQEVGGLFCEPPKRAVYASYTLGTVVDGQEQVAPLAVDLAHAGVAIEQCGELVLGEPIKMVSSVYPVSIRGR